MIQQLESFCNTTPASSANPSLLSSSSQQQMKKQKLSQ